MDLMAGLAAAAQALKIVKDVREIEKDFDTSALKAKMAEVYSSLADVKMALTDAQTAMHEKDQEIRALKAEIEALKSGDVCPLCNEGRFKTISSKAHPHFGFSGIQVRKIQCDKCGHSEDRMYDPDNRTGTNRRR